MGKQKLYIISGIACVAGYAWLGLNLPSHSGETHSYGVCMIKQVTGIPCPSCGSTRAALSVLQGDFLSAFLINPFGYIILLGIMVLPAWMLIDLATRRTTFHSAYVRTEKTLQQLRFALPLILLVVLNWIWNITKGL